MGVKQTEAMKAALTALKSIDEAMPFPVAKFAIRQLEEALAEQPAQQTIHCKHRRENNGVCPHHNLQCGWPKCNEPEHPAQQEPDRVKFERHWRKTRGDKKANRELPRHPLQPQTYIQDSANRHWVTWQAAVRSVSPPASKPWVGLTDEEWQEIDASLNGKRDLARIFTRAIEAKFKEKNQ